MQVHTIKPKTAYNIVNNLTNVTVAGLDLFGGDHFRDTLAGPVATGAAACNVVSGLLRFSMGLADPNPRAILEGCTDVIKAGGLLVAGYGAPIPGAILTGVGIASNLLASTFVRDH